jgi:hypothetical protein
MKATLYDKLKPEILKKLEAQKETYPLQYESIVNELKSKHYATEISVMCLSDLEILTDTEYDRPMNVSSIIWTYFYSVDEYRNLNFIN